MKIINIYLFGLVFLFTLFVNCVLTQRCLDGKSHKPEATPETQLFSQCKNWAALSCCNSTTTQDLHVNSTWYGFNYNHCGKMSDKCRSRFLQDLCLYECDPYLEKWIVQDYSKRMRTERFYNVPLCKNDCDGWFEDCKEDYTCRDNWNYGFEWRNGTNYCPKYSECKKFKDVFKTSENFCNSIWDGSFLVPNDPKTPCISFTFNSTDNPNNATARYYTPPVSSNMKLTSIYPFLFTIAFITLIIIK